MTDSQQLKILLVDDEPAEREEIKAILHELGHEIVEAADGLQAIELFNSINPDIVLLDIVIPQIDGLDVLREIRRKDKLCGVIMISALSSEQLAVKSILAGADDYVRKPFKLRNMRLNISRVVYAMQQRRAEIERISQLEAEVVQLRQELEAHRD